MRFDEMERDGMDRSEFNLNGERSNLLPCYGITGF